MEVEIKLSIFEKKSIDETEVVINCKSRNPEIDKLAKHILQYDESISCRRDGRDYNIRINDIFYIETVDNMCFASTENETYELRKVFCRLSQSLKTQQLQG